MGKLTRMYNDKTITKLNYLGADLRNKGYKPNKSSEFSKNLSGNDLQDIMKYINHWYRKSQVNKNVSGKHSPFQDFDFGYGWIYFL